MKTPKFWKHKNLISTALLPLGWLYGMATQIRLYTTKPYHATKPVICVGNLTAGGTGKTPVALSIAQLLQDNGKTPFFISRGYGGHLKNVLVDNKKHKPQEVGDEPLLLSSQAPTAVNPNRAAAAQLALDNGADCLIMDDGFQNPTLYKDVSFLVFDGTYGIGNGRILPSGPLRESFSSGTKRAQAIVILGEDKTGISLQSQLPVFYGNIVEEKPQDTNKNVLAFAGIGHPEKLYLSLEKCGLKVKKTIDFPDHHAYNRSELQNLITQAQENNLVLFTTSKDFVKIPSDLKQYFNVLKIKIAWQNKEELKTFLKKFLG